MLLLVLKANYSEKNQLLKYTTQDYMDKCAEYTTALCVLDLMRTGAQVNSAFHPSGVGK